MRIECLRLLATLKLDTAKSRLIGGFIETYLQLSAEELKQYEREFARMTPADKETMMELVTSWELRGRDAGRQEGRQEGKEEFVARLIKRRFGKISSSIIEQLDHLFSDQLNDLGEAILDFKTNAELETWLTRTHTPNTVE